MSHRQHHDPIQRLNEHHADDLLVIARALGGHADALSALAERVDRDGIDLAVETPRGPATVRVRFTEPVDAADDLGAVRVAFVRLARRARALSAASTKEPNAP